MNDSVLLRFSLIIFVAGLATLFLANLSYKPNFFDNINQADPATAVSVTGDIVDIKISSNVIRLRIRSDNEYVDAVIFSDKTVNVDKGQSVDISGEVSEYKGKKELIVDELRSV